MRLTSQQPAAQAGGERRRMQVGPTLYWTFEQPRVGDRWSTPDGERRVQSSEHDTLSNGWLVVVETAT